MLYYKLYSVTLWQCVVIYLCLLGMIYSVNIQTQINISDIVNRKESLPKWNTSTVQTEMFFQQACVSFLKDESHKVSYPLLSTIYPDSIPIQSVSF